MQRGAPPSPQPLSLLLCVTVTVLAVPILAWSKSSDDQQPVSIEVVAESPSTESEATGLLAEADPDELFGAGADDEQLPDNLAVMAPATPDWPIVEEEVAGRVVGKAPFGSEMSFSRNESPSASATADSAATTVAPTTTTRRTATTQAPTTAAPTTEPPTTQAPTTATPTTKPPTTQAPTTAAPAASESTSGEPTAAQWEALRQCESWGDYTVQSSNGLYHGAYQFGIGTWDNLASAVGRNDLVGVLPSVASPADQDMMALELWRRSGWAPWPSCGRRAAAAS